MTGSELITNIRAELHEAIPNTTTIQSVMERAGLRRQTLYTKRNTSRALTSLEAIAEALGYEIEYSYELKKKKG